MAWLVAIITFFVTSATSIAGTSGVGNDWFIGRTLIELNKTVAASTLGATRETGEPPHTLTNAPHTIWYEFTAPATGGYYIEDSLSHFDSPFNLYQGTALTNLVPIPTETQGSWIHGRVVRATAFHATAREKYLIAFAADRELQFYFTIYPSSLHDDFAHAIETSLSLDLTYEGFGGTLQQDEPTQNTSSGSFWHRFVAPSNGTYVAFVPPWSVRAYRGSSLKTLILAGTGTEIHPPGSFPFRAVAGEVIWISVNLDYSTTYTLGLVPVHQNDDFANRLPLNTSAAVEHPDWSTREPGEPVPSTNILTGSLWWKWIAPHSGLYRVSMDVPSSRSVLALYQGTNLASLALRAKAETVDSAPAAIDFFAKVGDEYSISSSHLSIGSVLLVLSLHSPPIHDNFEFALPLVLGETITNEFLIATIEPGEVAPPNTETLWYSWTAPTSGSFVFSIGYFTQYDIYTGSSLTNLTSIPSIRAPRGVAFRASAGTEYKFRVALPSATDVHITRASVTNGHHNDDFANPAELSGPFVSWTDSTLGGTFEPGEELVASDSLPSVWARWTAPHSGEFKLAPGDQNTLLFNLTVFSGTDLTTLEPIGTTSAAGTRFLAQTGVTYLIRIANQISYIADFSINLGPFVPNEQPSSAIELTGNNISVLGQNWSAATVSIANLSRAIWWRWTAPTNGMVTYSINSNVLGSVVPFHAKIPTVESNLHPSLNFHSGISAASRTNTIGVNAGISYLFKFEAEPSTNIGFNLIFTELPTNLGSFTGAIFGGTNFWEAVPSVFTPGTEGLSITATNRSYGWIELEFPGPGRLTFKAKMENGSMRVEAQPKVISSFSFSYRDWYTPRHIPLVADTNVVRFTFTSGSATAQAWIDDIQFVPDPPLRPGIQLYRFNADDPLRLHLQIQADRTTAVETSTNLLDWIHWTNIYAPRTDYGFQLPIPPNDTPHFFRLRLAD